MSKNVAQVHLVNAMHEDDVGQEHDQDHDAVDVDHDDDVDVEHLGPCVAPWCYIVKGRARVKEEKCLLRPNVIFILIINTRGKIKPALGELSKDM